MIARPNETTTMIVKLRIAPWVIKATWFAKTNNPGSATEIKNPKINPDMIRIHMDLLFDRAFPV